MNDYKELVDVLRSGAWSVYKINSPAAMCETIYNAQIADAIEELVKERDAALADLKYTSLGGRGCAVCKNKNYPTSDVCVNCHTGTLNDHWEWQGVQE